MQPPGLPLQSLALDPAIDPHFLSVTPDTPLLDALALMSQYRACLLPSHNLNSETKILDRKQEEIACLDSQWDKFDHKTNPVPGCVLVMEKSRLIGVFTERDIVRLTARGIPWQSLKIADVVKQPVIELRQSEDYDIFTALGLFRQYRIRHLPIVCDRGKPIGIVTYDSIRRALQPVNLLTRLRFVKDVMTTQVIHATATTSVLKLAQIMTDYQISSVVITENRQEERDNEEEGEISLLPLTSHLSPFPVGIVTERDIVQFQALQLDLSRMLARDVMSTPLFCLQPSDSLWLAHQTMQKYHVRRLIITGNGGELVGIVSQTSLLKVLNPADMYGVIELLQQAVEERTWELQETNEQLRHEVQERKKAETELRIARDNLKIEVEERTAELTQTNLKLQEDIQERKRVETALRKSEAKLQEQTKKLEQALQEVRSYQSKLIQTEKMSSLGQMVAGVAHEINNPINFIYGNIAYANQYIQDIMRLLEIYQKYDRQNIPEIQKAIQDIDLNFIKNDLPKLINSMKVGADRIRDLVVSLRSFSRLDEAEIKSVNIHEGLDSTLLILQNQIKATPIHSEIQIIKEYGNLPLVECYPGQLNQVFMNLIGNAIDALEELRQINLDRIQDDKQELEKLPKISITTEIKQVKNEKQTNLNSLTKSHLIVRIADNGSGMSEEVREHLFDPFFTTKPVGKGTGLGLSISYQIVVKKHGGDIWCNSTPGQGTEFIVEIPIQQGSRH
ncbi:MAG TPA: signal transduction histidine kinase regulating C4-dicarboxylate transporter [Cyanobacteria bacterium UBA11149]|nr:signal transduction histidine kinase regulating C4-dicarboxylate transporter [Cyanobacteria bacterium UBA11367]HBE56724.1 signal transduction histidine kinase regulating C4-dicarboxylate transporter [Cyanobacteria bacterium UBA11366]HBK63032.1 signal transduction histidine kinase regulating C4-dicarboxylate transporter [Cyanobacteria bacterium UBA11166]HBR75936.1 signal transduction histidine kinase regulating C4-dicarboxylate transporter [Cyanobacteria bacterium UBA11159]HBS71405.1 signal t